jgi:leucyl aminopeptidase
MKSSVLLSLSAVALAAALATPKEPQVVFQNPQVTIDEPDEYLIELSPGETRWVTEDEKWALRRVCTHLVAVMRASDMLTVTAKHQLLRHHEHR